MRPIDLGLILNSVACDEVLGKPLSLPKSLLPDLLKRLTVIAGGIVAH